MAAIYNYQTGDAITQGLRGCKVCDEAIQMAGKIASERQQPVMLDDDDGQWVVYPDGSIEESDTQHAADAYDAEQKI